MSVYGGVRGVRDIVSGYIILFLFIRVDEPAGDLGIDGYEFKSGIPAEFWVWGQGVPDLGKKG